MSAGDIASLLAERARLAHLDLSEALGAQLAAYFRLLSHWNRTINLTSLSDPVEAVDRLLLEPVAAAAHLPSGTRLIDLGSGGGSPAIPLALALRVSRLVMVESRTRKAAFLRETLRELRLDGAVEAMRYEDVAEQPAYLGGFGVLSVRAIRQDRTLFAAIERLLDHGGYAALFGSTDSERPEELPPGLMWVFNRPLIPASHSTLTVLQRV